MIRLLHQEDERETTKKIGEVKMCVICEEHEPNAKILPCSHSASCSVCTQKVIDVGNGNCPFCREKVSGKMEGMHETVLSEKVVSLLTSRTAFG